MAWVIISAWPAGGTGTRTRSITLGIATFRVAIRNIVSRGAQKQMAWIAAGRVVAFVEDFQLRWKWSDVEPVSNSMGFNIYTPHAHLSVSIMIALTGPWPARIRASRFVDLRFDFKPSFIGGN